MLKYFLWLKYLSKKKIVILSILAVALSAALLITVNSIFTGFIQLTEEYLVEDRGQLTLLQYADVNDHYKITAAVNDLDIVQSASPYISNAGLLWLQTGDVREVMVYGIDPESELEFRDNQEFLVDQKQQGYDHFTWLGIGIAGEPNEVTDEYDIKEVRNLIGKKTVLTISTSQRKRDTSRMTVTNIAQTQTYLGDKSLFVPLKSLHEKLFGEGDYPYYLYKIKLKPGVSITEAKDAILASYRKLASEQLGLPDELTYSARVFDMKQDADLYLSEIRKQLNILLIVFGVICSASVLLIFCIFYMIIVSHIKDIAIIKSCGAKSVTIISMFAGFAVAIGFVGSALGVGLGYLITVNLDKIENAIRVIFGIKLWRASAYQFYTIPTQMDYSSVWWITTAAILGCLVGALIPAIKAAAARPVRILRYE